MLVLEVGKRVFEYFIIFIGDCNEKKIFENYENFNLWGWVDGGVFY